MKQTLKHLTLGILTALSSAQAGAVVLDFEDLPYSGTPPTANGGYFSDLPNAAYHGFVFGNTTAQSWFWNPNPDQNPIPADNRYNASSGTVWVGNAGPNSPEITSATDFTFDGASFAGFDTINFELFLNNSLVFTSADCTLGETHQFCASGYTGLVDRVVFVSKPDFGSTYFAMDNFTYNSASVVPEPGGYAMMASGLVALAVAGRRRKKAP